MKRQILWLVPAVVGALLIVFQGCAQKATVMESRPIEERRVAPQAAPAPQRDTVAEDEARRRAMEEAARKERALKEREAREAALFADILFDFDKSTIGPEFRDRLKQQADWLGANTWRRLTIEGNCDERGTTEYNLALGQRRAEAAKKFLVALGVKAGKIRTISYGKEKPLNVGHDEEAWARNRRDHFVLAK